MGRVGYKQWFSLPLRLHGCIDCVIEMHLFTVRHSSFCQYWEITRHAISITQLASPSTHGNHSHTPRHYTLQLSACELISLLNVAWRVSARALCERCWLLTPLPSPTLPPSAVPGLGQGCQIGPKSGQIREIFRSPIWLTLGWTICQPCLRSSERCAHWLSGAVDAR